MELPAHLRFTAPGAGTLHLGVCGSIAAYKSLDLLRLFLSAGFRVTCTLTAAAQQFIHPLSFSSLGADCIDTDMFGGQAPEYAHLAPGRGAKAMVIAPVTANTLARLAHGLADDMLSCQALSFPGSLVLAPAMNPNLWHAAPTQANVSLLQARGHVFVGPVSGSVACGDTGKGRFAPLLEIFLCGLKAMTVQDMQGKRILLTIGPTREHWDAVRFWSNPSTGTMGASLAVAAWLRGAEVTAVCGPGAPWLPSGVQRRDVTSAAQMLEASVQAWPTSDIGCCTAAVADFRPAQYSEHKRKKASLGGELSIPFVGNADILATLGTSKEPGQRLVGFAAETGELEEQARDKLSRKSLDMIVANRIDQPDAGFAAATNKVYVLGADGRQEHWPVLPKPEIAWRIWDWLLLTSS